jgi:NADPH-dependent ferric siderophore reductase
VHGDGPGARWVRGLAVGDACQVFGPRGSVAVDPSVPTVFVGDETSFALLAAWHQTNPDALPVAAVFEVSDPDESAAVFEAEQLAATLFVPRLPDDGHVVALGAAVVEALRAAPDAGLLLTGKAQTIAELRRDLKAADLHGRRTKAKAYWDERRSGLD